VVPADFFRSIRVRHTARLYASRLPRQLIDDYGSSETYTEAQITASIRRAKLPEAGLVLAYAEFLPEPEFVAKYGSERLALRQLFRDSLPVVPSSDMQNSNEVNHFVGSVGQLP
jgi:hypothetical protein